jgi:DNA-binding transcriptional ArsR family regulator
MVVDIAKNLGKQPALVSKHLAVLRKAGIVQIKQRLHFIPAPFIADAAKRILDLGHCVLRLDAESA